MARIARIIGGTILVLAGIFMLVLPGPGIITIIGGLALLAQDVPWAGRLRDWVKERFAKYAGEENG
ncbi:MAG: PGPGW domain-containing protein [Acidimicrobiia bacterium]